MKIYEILKSAGLPCVYSHFSKPQEPPFIVYIGSGQDTFSADNTFVFAQNRYQVEYYFMKKDEEAEEAIETALLEGGFHYQKSEDIYIEDQDLFVIYYYI